MKLQAMIPLFVALMGAVSIGLFIWGHVLPVFQQIAGALGG